MTGLHALTHPAGLPIGEEWVPAPSSAPVVFPFSGELVAEAPVGTSGLAGEAITYAAGLRQRAADLPSHVRRTALLEAQRAVADRRTSYARSRSL